MTVPLCPPHPEFLSSCSAYYSSIGSLSPPRRVRALSNSARSMTTKDSSRPTGFLTTTCFWKKNTCYTWASSSGEGHKTRGNGSNLEHTSEELFLVGKSPDSWRARGFSRVQIRAPATWERLDRSSIRVIPKFCPRTPRNLRSACVFPGEECKLVEDYAESEDKSYPTLEERSLRGVPRTGTSRTPRKARFFRVGFKKIPEFRISPWSE